MKKIVLRNIAMLFSIGALLAIVGCDSVTRTSGANEVDFRGYTGETFYKSLIYGEGPSELLWPEIWGDENLQALRSENAEQTAEVSDRVTRYIDEEYPSFFSDFKSALISGNQLQVSEALDHSGEITLDALKSLDMLPDGKVGESLHTQQVGPVVAVAAAAVVAVAVARYAAVVDGAVLFVRQRVRVFNDSNSDSDLEAQLGYDSFINDVTLRFSSLAN